MTPTHSITDPVWQDIVDRDQEIDRLRSELEKREALILACHRAFRVFGGTPYERKEARRLLAEAIHAKPDRHCGPEKGAKNDGQ